MSEIVKSEPPDGSILNLIASVARDPSANVENLRALIAMQKEIVAEQARIAFEVAMSAVQSEMRPVLRDATNEHTRSKYARLEHIAQVIQPIYSRHGFSVSFNNPDETDGSIVVTCELAHQDGHTKTFRLAGAPDAVGSQGKSNKTAIQAVGSTVSYLRRYLLCMIFNVSLTDDDNDGEVISPITVHQWRELADLIAETKSDQAQFLAFMKIGDLADMPQHDFQKAKTALLKKKSMLPQEKPA